ncbi:Proteasome activator pa28, REG alpha/beta subunit [Mycena venus]|uniref:Proteasome activator pa28, REG alpha/beta subunit n=1 Tax=Mycena venus TaxID=2733690 RepID=A0A8H7CU90_9AGAR|nr:Proteasome activator pa28, REG alpha/beta subunit [Mycena venus]
MEKDLAARLEAFQKHACVTGENVVFRVFPAKILELQEMIQSTSSPSSPYHRDQTSTTTDATVYPAPAESSQANGEQPQLKKRKMDDSSLASTVLTNDTQHARLPSLVHANKHMGTLHATLKRECEQLVTLTDQVKLWISLTMPKIEGGDNFGVQIQEEVVAELLRSQESAFNLRDSARNDYLTRAKICSKLIKYPNVEDYTLALKEHDDNQFYLARQHLVDLRNIYAVLTDLIHKNIAKVRQLGSSLERCLIHGLQIRAPRGNNSVGLY